MNSWPTLSEWCRFGGILALELLAVFVIAKLLTLRLRSAQWRRALWQTSLVAMLLVTGGELNGVRSLIRFQSPSPTSQQRRAVVVTIKEPDLSLFPPTLSEPTQPAPFASKQDVPTWERRLWWPMLAWLAGLGLVLSRSLLAQAFTVLFRLPSRRVNDAELNERAQRLADALGIRRRVTMVESARAIAPFTFGIWKPVIVLPKNFVAAFTPEQRDVALAHELAHVANFDSAWRCLSQFVCALLWWHPFAWLAKRELDHASELVADEASLLVADGPNRLAECLVTCAKQFRKPALVAWLGMDGGGFRSTLGKRVARLLQLNPSVKITRPLPWFARILAPAMCASFLWLVVALIEKPHANGTDWRSSIVGATMARPADVSPALITQSRSAVLQTNQTGPGTLSDSRTSTNAPITSAEQKAVSDKLQQIRFSEYGPIDNLPLSEVIRSLSEEARRRDPEKKGVNFFLTPQRGRRPGDDETIDINAVSIRVGMLLRDITLEQVLRIVIDAAERPIQVSVEDYGILITPVFSTGETILTRMFKVDPWTFLQNLEAIERPGGGRRASRPNANKDLLAAATSYLNRAGLNFNRPGRSIFFNDRNGTIAVRATEEELETVEKMVQLANTSPQQLILRVKVMEVSLSSSNAAWEWFVGGTLATNVWSGQNPSNPPTVTGILTDQQFRAAVRNLEKRGGTDLLSAPEVTTLSGRQAQIKVVDVRYIVTDLDITTNAFSGKQGTNVTGGSTTNKNGIATVPIAEPFEIGPVVDIIPTVQPDGYTIHLSVAPRMREFLGYDDPGQFVAEVKGETGKVETQPVPLPKFRLREAAASAVVRDGQTLVISAGTARHSEREGKRDGTFTTRYTDKALFFFVTPRLIDAAGNSVHSDEESK